MQQDRFISLAGPPGNEDSLWREAGYREALRAHDSPFDPSLVGIGIFDDVDGHASVEAWRQQGLDFDAIFAGDDEAASGLILALRWAGKRVSGQPATLIVLPRSW